MLMNELENLLIDVNYSFDQYEWNYLRNKITKILDRR